MSRVRAQHAIRCQPTDRVPVFEMIEHPGYIREITGIDPFTDPRRAYAEAYKRNDVDIVLRLPKRARQSDPRDGVITDQEGRVFAEWGVAEGSIWESTLPFTTVDEVFDYDPFSCSVGEYPIVIDDDPNKDVEEIARTMQASIDDQQSFGPDEFLVPGANFFVLFHYFVTTFGWELSSEAALCYGDKFEAVIDRFAALSYKLSQAWALTDVELFVAHDDIAMNNRTIFSPDWLRKHIFPRYKEILEPIRDAGKKVIYFSDGDYTCVLDDLDDVGFDGYVFEPQMDLGYMIERYGGNRVLCGNADVRVLTLGTPDDVCAEIDRCFTLGRGVPGYIMSAPGSLPQNIPIENMRAYFDYLSEQR